MKVITGATAPFVSTHSESTSVGEDTDHPQKPPLGRGGFGGRVLVNVAPAGSRTRSDADAQMHVKA